MSDRKDIPAEVKRSVRQRCGFGCVLCGSPVFDYEHMTGYQITGNDPDDMTLLCPAHHREKTAKRLPVARVRRANKRPFNRSQKMGAEHALNFEGEFLNLDLGSVRFEGTSRVPAASVIVIDDEPVVRVRFERHGAISLDLSVRDADNRPLLIIRRGQLRHSTASWDITFEGTTLTVRRKPRDIVLRIEFAPPDRIKIERAELWASGILLRVGKSCVNGNGIEIANNQFAMDSLMFRHMGTMLAVGDFLGLEGAAFTVPLSQRWFGGRSASPGSFSSRGGGQFKPYTDPSYLDGCAPTLTNSFLSDAIWGRQ